MVSAPISKALIKFPKVNLKGRHINSGEYFVPKDKVSLFGGGGITGSIFSSFNKVFKGIYIFPI
jgi:hypothetical protein